MTAAPEPLRETAGPAGPRVAHFLRLVRERGLAEPGVGETLRVEKLLASREQWGLDEMCAALASLLAGSEESWRLIRNLGLEVLHPDCAEQGPADSRASEVGTTEAGTSGHAAKGEKHRKRRWAAVALAAGVLLALLGLFLYQALKPEPTVDPLPGEDEVTQVEPIEGSTWVLQPFEVEVEIEREESIVTRPLDWRDALAVAAGFFLLTLAVRWWHLPEESRKQRQTELDAEHQERIRLRDTERNLGYIRREKLARELLEAGENMLVPFQVPETPAVSKRAIDDAAVVLGRLQHELPGSGDLDVEASVAATLEAGGRTVPIFERGRLQATLLVLVDDEGSDHPYLAGFQRVLDHWQRRGVRMLRFTFCEQPDHLRPHPRGRTVSFDQLSRHYPGLPLVIFSRRLTHRAVAAGGAAWTRRLEVWPVKAWIDPDPTPLKEATRRPGFKQDKQGLERLGLTRFGLDEQDLPVLARYLAEGGVGIRPPKRRPLTKETPEIEAALRAWAVAAARVPEAGWDLLEHLRRSLREEIGQWLPERRHVALLIRWVNRRQGTTRRRHQRFLEIEDAQVETLRREQAEVDKALPEEQRLLARVARMLIEQLQATKPKETLRLLKLRWQLKRAELALVMEPEKARALLAEFRGSALDAVAEDIARAHVAEGSLPEAHREELVRSWFPGSESFVQAKVGVSLRTLVWGFGRLWRAAAILVGIGGAMAALAVSDMGGFFFGQKQVGVVDRLPATTELVEVETLEETENRPTMIAVPPGDFMMGSPDTEDGRFDDEIPHKVVITQAFYLAATEVTQAQYLTVMGSNPAQETECGASCPVENVSWIDAVTYANEISELEGLKRCYQIEGETVAWEAGLGCEGYRLPTEAEWEYAARAGTTDRYAGTDNPKEVCRYANVSQRFFECEDGYLNLAPVEEFEPNGYGLFDMTGNVYEWVWDWYDDYPRQAAQDPTGPVNGRYRVIRGGSFDVIPQDSRVADRIYGGPSFRNPSVGFRVARSLP